jgi:hypothetical protein
VLLSKLEIYTLALPVPLLPLACNQVAVEGEMVSVQLTLDCILKESILPIFPIICSVVLSANICTCGGGGGGGDVVSFESLLLHDKMNKHKNVSRQKLFPIVLLLIVFYSDDLMWLRYLLKLEIQSLVSFNFKILFDLLCPIFLAA